MQAWKISCGTPRPVGCVWTHHELRLALTHLVHDLLVLLVRQDAPYNSVPDGRNE